MVVKIEVWPRLSRAIIGLFLLMHWAVLHSDDCQGIDASCLPLTEVCRKGTSTKTKTTGPGKHMREVPFFVSRDCVLSGTDWLVVGFQIWVSTDYQIKRDFFVLAENEDRSGPVNKRLPPVTIIAFVRSVRAEYKLLNGAETVVLVKSKVAAVRAKTPWKPNYALAVAAVGLCAAQACLGLADGTSAYTAVDIVTNSSGTLLDTSDDGCYNCVWRLLMLPSIYGAYKLVSAFFALQRESRTASTTLLTHAAVSRETLSSTVCARTAPGHRPGADGTPRGERTH